VTGVQSPTRDSLGRTVFVIHGRNKTARREFFTFLRSIGLDPMEWNETLAATEGGAPIIRDVLDSVLKMPHAFIVLLTPDDEVRLKPELANSDEDPDLQLSGQARPNVLFEAGMAFALAPTRTILIEFGKVRPFTDIAGRYVVKLNNSSQRRNTLAQLLAQIGCEVNLTGNDWHTSGDLTPPTFSSGSSPWPEPHSPTSDGPKITTSVGDHPLTLRNFNAIPRVREGLSLHGEAINNGLTTLTILLKATFYSPQDKIVGTATGFVNSISRGEMRTFELTTRDNVEGYERIHVQVDTAVEG
jgi:predicted nucleotide-binding protein